MREWFIPGEPAVWLTNREGPWKQQIAAAVQFDSAAPPAHLDLDFRVASFRRGGNYFDLDNMVTPVLAALLGGRGSESRHALLGWSATRVEHGEPGLALRASDTVPAESGTPPDPMLVLDITLQRPFPTDSREGGTALVQALHSAMGEWRPLPSHQFAVHLDFGDDQRDISWVCERPIKPIVDCLFPIFGGGPGAPDDWKMHSMRVRRSVAGLDGECAVRVWEISGSSPATAAPPSPARSDSPLFTPPRPVPLASRKASMTNYDRLDQAAAAIGSPPAELRLAAILAQAQAMFPEMASVSKDSASATLDYQTINVRSRAAKPGNFDDGDRWNRHPAFIKVGIGVWRRLSDHERERFASLWSTGTPLLRQESYDAAEWDRLMSAAR